MAIIQVTKENYDEIVLASGKTVLLDFWAPWCGPCRMIAPILEEIANQRQDVLIGKINVEEEEELAKKFNVGSIPMVAVVKQGIVTAVASGYKPRAAIEKLLTL